MLTTAALRSRPRHISGFTQRRQPVVSVVDAYHMITLRRIFTAKDLRSVTRIGIVAPRMVKEPVRFFVIMFIQNIGMHGTQLRVEIIKAGTIGIRAHTVYQFKIRIF